MEKTSKIKQGSSKYYALETQVRRTIRKYDMLRSGEHVLVAASGGADSTALLLCLHRLASEFQLSLTVAHLNHNIRGSEGDADQEFVRRMSNDLKLPIICEIIDIKQQAAAAKHNLEDYARQKRYEFLYRAAQQVESKKIAVGHTLDDQAETVMMHFLRGSGLEGLSAIHPVVDQQVIRPLLECSRSQILDYIKEHGARYCEDSTNQDLRYRRNRIRQELIPYLKKYFNPALLQTLDREASQAREIHAFLDSQSKQAFNTLRGRIKDGISLPVIEIQKLHAALQKRIVRHALKECWGSLRGATARHVDDILSLCRSNRSGSRICLPYGSIVLRQFGDLLFLKKETPAIPGFSYQLALPGQVIIAEAKMRFSATMADVPELEKMKKTVTHEAYLNPALLPKVLTIRSRLPGDRYGGSPHRKVKKMLIDAKVPLTQRSILPMVVVRGHVVWIPGFRPAARYEAQHDSKRCLRLKVDILGN